MDEATHLFARRYRRFLQAAALASRLAPGGLAEPLARCLGRQASPYRSRAGHMMAAMRGALGLDEQDAATAWRKWLENHGLFALSICRYGSLGAGWLHDLVRVVQPEVLERIAQQGGLVMTCHCHHQNMLAARIGLACGNISPLASTAESSPLYPVLGRQIEAINRDSAQWFGGGRYLFTGNTRSVVRAARQVLAQGATLLTLCDSHAPATADAPLAHFLGRRIAPPVGAVSIAVRMGAPLYAAIMAPGDGGLDLRMRELGTASSVEAAVSGYFAYLEEELGRCPAAWQGWEWWDALPKPQPDSNETPYDAFD